MTVERVIVVDTPANALRVISMPEGGAFRLVQEVDSGVAQRVYVVDDDTLAERVFFVD